MQHPFPSISPFLELIQWEERTPNKIILRDRSTGRTATAGQLLHSVALFRAKVQAILGKDSVDNVGNSKENRIILLLAPPGLEYVVSMLTIFSLGAGMSAQSTVIRPVEMKRIIELAKPLALLYAPALNDKVEAMRASCVENTVGSNTDLPFVEISIAYQDIPASNTYKLEQSIELGSNRIGTLFFTSGTSGSPKGVVHSYSALLASARERIEAWQLTETDVVLNQKPGNWMGGIFGIIPSLISGACLETCADVFNPKWFWERIGGGDVTVFSIAPEGYDRLMEYFDEHIASLSPARMETYVRGMITAKFAGVTGSLLLPQTQKRWTDLRRGKPLLNLYGSTEVMLICSMRWESPNYSDMCSIGLPVPGVEVKLVEGELRLKAPTMFSRYISNDPTQTEKAFDSEGYFKTGDFAENLGDCYVLHGRANIDVLHFWGFTLYTSEIESALLSLPYIANAIVLPLQDDQFQQRAAAILQIKPSFQSKRPGLDTLRNDLTEKTGLMLFKQPTVVYWLSEREEISLTANGKVSKIDARNKFFGEGWKSKQNVEILDLRGMEYWRMGGQC